MNKVTLKISTLIFTMLITFITLSESIACAEEVKDENLKILFISSYNSNFISFEDQVEGIKAGLNENVHLRIEYMDFKVLGYEENEERFYNLLKLSFENYEEYDAIIAGDDEALEFCLKYRDDLFKDIPISFLGVQKEKILEEALKYEKVSGVREMESIESNLELIKKFHPNTENIIFLNDYGEHFYIDITSKNPEFDFQKIITSELTIDEFKETIKNVKENSVIISLYPDDFKNGEWVKVLDVNELISNIRPDLPIYNVLDYGIGTGSVGGKVINHFTQGKRAGEVVLGLLEGIDEKNLYFDNDEANQYVFDYKILRKFNIKTKYLPDNSKIINSPIEVIEEYKSLFIYLFIIFLVLLLLILALIQYINYKKRYEKEILNAKNKAEEANNLKAHFISNISHELKTPINVILCATQLIELKNSKNNQENQNSNISIVKDNCYRLIRLISNIIDIEKAELNDLKLNLENDNIVSLTEDIVMSVIPYAEKKNLNLIFDTDEEVVMIEIDTIKIERVILNLLSNSIKFSKENGYIGVKIRPMEEYVDIIVEDNGVGISKEELPNIFERFRQVDNSLTRKNEGSGIGLSIVKSLVELHSGEIRVESELNKGTRFIVKLPKGMNVNSNNKYIRIEEDQECKKNIMNEIIMNEIRNINYRTKTELSDIYV
ncbi:sensor histidine kinase [Clostridium sp. D53t1_180928_C8]|uniref:sensor histidine kinase n=1 Tax=Clostridium sp. D53t1_180928_C8 TaxID=2787101 RepID=UPI0018AC328D|nr:sensor histidine kinase [Clostridium sp. D53t1_180928_C8]